MTHGLIIPQKGIWNDVSFFYPKLLLLLFSVSNEGALIPIVLKIYVWRLVRSQVELSIYHMPLTWPGAESQDFRHCPSSCHLPSISSFWHTAAMHVPCTWSSYFSHYIGSPAFLGTLSGIENN